MSDPHPETLPAPETQATTAASFPLNGSLTAGLEYTFTSSAGYAFTAIYNATQPDGCLKVKTKDGIDGYVNPTAIAVAVLAAVSARA